MKKLTLLKDNSAVFRSWGMNSEIDVERKEYLTVDGESSLISKLLPKEVRWNCWKLIG